MGVNNVSSGLGNNFRENNVDNAPGLILSLDKLYKNMLDNQLKI